MHSFWPALLLLAATLVGGLPNGWAHEGHDHGPPAPMALNRPLAPRVTAESAEFELVATLDGQAMEIWLDGFPTNVPVEDAAIEVEGGGFKGTAGHRGGSRYRLDAPALARPGRHDLIFTIRTPRTEDLLLATLEVKEEATPASAPTAPAPQWYENPRLLQGVVGAMALWVLLLLIRSDRRGNASESDKRDAISPRDGISALILPLLMLTLGFVLPAGDLRAHGGEDHSHGDTPPPAVTGDGAARLPDGRLFVPKPVQHLLGLRTEKAEAGEWPDAFTLTGHVIADPNASGFVQAPLRGRIEAAEGGLPLLGGKVEQGQVLAWLTPILDAVDHTAQQADVTEMTGKVAILSRNLERLRQLGNNAPRKELDETETELTSLMERRKAVVASFSERRPITAPVGGVIAARNAAPGQVVEGGATLFSIIDPQRLWVEALLYDLAHATHFVSAGARLADGQILQLSPAGMGYELRGHALPIHFRIERPLPVLSVQQPVTVIAQAYHSSKGVRIPTRSVQRGGDGAEQVWVHTRAEEFAPMRVKSTALDGGYSLVAEGLKGGERVVTEGASLLGQVR